MTRMLAQIKRHLDILVPLIALIFSAGVLYSQNNEAVAQNADAISHLARRVDKHDEQIEKLSEIKSDVAAIKEKQDLMWNFVRGRK